jgi:PAS domain S-box-containing protein
LETLRGYSPSILSDTSVADLVQPGSERSFIDIIDAVLYTSSPTTSRLSLSSTEGVPHWFDCTMAPTGSPGQIIFMGQITDHQVRAEAQLRESEERFRMLVDNAPVGIVMAGKDRRITAANPQFHRLLGYADQELIGQPYQTVRFTNTADAVESMLSDIAGGADTGEAVREYRKKNGESVWVSVDLVAVRDELGRFLYTIGTVQDLTARVGAEREALDQQSRFRSIYERAPIGIALLNAKREVVSANPVLCGMLGYGEDELAGTNLGNLRSEESPRTNRQQFSRLIRGEINEFTLSAVLMNKSGSHVWTESLYAAIPNESGPPTTVIRMVQDVTLSKLAERELAEREERLRQIVEQSPFGIVLVDRDNKVMSVNPAGEATVGYPNDEMVGYPIGNMVPASYVRQNRSRFGRLVSGELDQFQNERPFERQDGSVFMGRSTWSAVRDAEGIFLLCVMILEDITEIRRTQRLKDEFLAVVGHELRTPLTSINAVLGLLASGTLGEPTPRATELLTLAQNNSDRLKRLIDDQLDLERLANGNMPLYPEATTVTALINAARAATSPEFWLESTIPADLNVNVDPDRVIQVFTNLFTNAMKFAPVGSAIRVNADIVEGMAQVSVIDSGRGIPTDQLERIFERFYQVDSTDARRAGGTGIGLAISRQIIEAHNGHIWAESVLGKGTTMKFTVPLS